MLLNTFMPYKTFSRWLVTEKKDIFGFDKENRIERRNIRDDLPSKRFNVEQMMNYLKMHEINGKRPNLKFFNELHWGTGTGAIKVWLGTGLNVMVEKQAVDLTGEPRWFCHKVFQIDQSGYGGFEDAVAHELLDVVRRVDDKPMPTTQKAYSEMENLVVSMANKMKMTARNIFMYEGVTKIDDYQYIIRFSVRGGGVEAQDQQRILENQTNVSFSPETGLIRVFNYNIESAVGSAPGWELMEKDTDWYFAPNQSRDEIVETIANTIHWY